MTAPSQNKPIHLRLPATSANLGPGFDALGLAMALYLTIDATTADDFHIDATGRNADLCANLEDNLILTTYIIYPPTSASSTAFIYLLRSSAWAAAPAPLLS